MCNLWISPYKHMIAPLTVKKPWRIWVNASRKSTKSNGITTTQQNHQHIPCKNTQQQWKTLTIPMGSCSNEWCGTPKVTTEEICIKFRVKTLCIFLQELLFLQKLFMCGEALRSTPAISHKIEVASAMPTLAWIQKLAIHWKLRLQCYHMSIVASQITGNLTVCSTVCLG